MDSIYRAILLFFITNFCTIQSSNQVPVFDHGVNLPTTRPLNIAHRGSSGTLPAHSAGAYQTAVDQGADVIECDVTVTKDLELVCLHESWMSGTTNVEDVFPPDRMNTYFILGQLNNVTDYFSVDFTLTELKQIRLVQTYSYRNPNQDHVYEISSIDEYIAIAQNAGRPVGIYPELKDPTWVNSLDIIQNAGTTFEDLLLAKLASYGYTANTDPCFVQSFDEDTIRYLSNRTSLPLVLLLPPVAITNDDRLAELATFVYGIGPSKQLIVRVNVKDEISERTDLVDRAHAHGLKVHPYTLRNEDQHLPWDYLQDPYNEFEDYLNLTCDGLFTDFPGSYSRFLDAEYGDIV